MRMKLKTFVYEHRSIDSILNDNDNEPINSIELAAIYCPIDDRMIALLPRLKNIRKMNFQTIDISSQTLSTLLNGTLIESLSFRFQTLDENHVRVLSDYPNFLKLSFIHCKVGIQSFIKLFNHMVSQLVQLKFYDKKFSRNLFESIAHYCKRTIKMKILEIGSPDDDSDEKSDFGQTFEILTKSNLLKLSLSEFNFDSTLVKSFKRFLKKSQLEDLSLEMIGITETPDTPKLFSKTHLKKLSLKGSLNGEKSIRNIPHLKCYPTPSLVNFIQSFEIKSIDLSDYRCGPWFSDFLNLIISSGNSSLESFCFNNDYIEVDVLVNFIKYTKVKKLVLNGYHRKDCDLTEALCENKFIEALFFNFFKFGDVGKIVQMNKSLRFFHSSNTLLSGAELIDLSEKMIGNYTLIHLGFQTTHPAIQQILQRNQRIKNFHKERLWLKCYPFVNEKSMIPSIIVDQWNQLAAKNDPNLFKRVILSNYDDDKTTTTRAKFIDPMSKISLFCV